MIKEVGFFFNKKEKKNDVQLCTFSIIFIL